MKSWLAFGAMSGITRTKIMPSFSITGAFALRGGAHLDVRAAVKPQSPTSVLVVSASFSSSAGLNSRAGRRAHRVGAIRIGRAVSSSANAASVSQPEPSLAARLSAVASASMPVFLPAALPLFLQPEEALHDDQLGERGAILLLRDRDELLAERRKARIV